jgi:hypothetical protein
MKNHTSSIIFAIAIVIASLVFANGYVQRNRPIGTMTVTGLGEKDFTSDLIVWDGFFSKSGSDLKIASEQLSNDKRIIEEYLISKGVSKSEIIFSAVSIQEQKKQRYSDDGKYIGQEFEGYKLVQPIQINSKDINKIEGISREISELLSQGIQFQSEPPRYYYTKLSQLKLELVEKATVDARQRAEKISEKSGGKIGKLSTAQMGIFQITGQNSSEEYSWGGTFNTSSKEKSASITMKLTYQIK